MLKRQNEELSGKLQQLGAILTRTKEELARYRVSNGKDPYEQIEEEELLRKKLDVCLHYINLSTSYAWCEDCDTDCCLIVNRKANKIEVNWQKICQIYALAF